VVKQKNRKTMLAKNETEISEKLSNGFSFKGD